MEHTSSEGVKSTILLGTPTLLEPGDLAAWERLWPTSTCSYMGQHCVGSTPLAPGMAYLFIVRQAVVASGDEHSTVCITAAQFTAMLVLNQCTPLLQVSMQPQPKTTGTVVVRIQSSAVGSDLVQHAMVDVVTAEDDDKSIHNGPACESKPRVLFTATTGMNKHIQLGQWADSKPQLTARGTMLAWVLHEAAGSAGKITYLQCGQLEVVQAQYHMYDAAWSMLPGAYNSSSIQQHATEVARTKTHRSGSMQKAVEDTGGAVAWDCESTYPHRLDMACNSTLVLVLGLDELCTVQGATLLCCYHTGSSMPGGILQAVQTAGTGVSVWVLGCATCDQSSTYYSVGVWGLAKSVNSDNRC